MSRLPTIARAGKRVRRKLADVRQRRLDPDSIAADVSECAGSYELTFDAPGVTAEELDVRYVDGSVSVRVERYREFYDGFELQAAGRALALAGTIDLPGDADVSPEAGEAVIRANGTLHVRVPKETAADVVATTDDSES